MRKDKNFMIMEVDKKVGRRFSEYCKKNCYVSCKKLSAIINDFLEKQLGVSE